MMRIQLNRFINVITLMGQVGILLSTVMYGTWIVAGMDKRLALAEQRDQQQILIDQSQDTEHAQFERMIDSRLDRMEDKIDLIINKYRNDASEQKRL